MWFRQQNEQLKIGELYQTLAISFGKQIIARKTGDGGSFILKYHIPFDVQRCILSQISFFKN